MRWIRRLVALTLLVGVWYFGWQFAAENQTPVTIHYVAGALESVALWKVLLVSFGSGVALVTAYHMYSSLRNGLVSRRYRKTIGGLEAEVHQLRNLPLAPEADARAGPASAPDAASAPVVGTHD